MKTLAVALLAASLLAGTSPAWACSPGPLNPISAAQTAGLPGRMLAAAAYVDVAIAERAHAIDLDILAARRWRDSISSATSRPEREDRLEFMRFERARFAADGLAVVQFRSVERLKGAGAKVFLLSAFTTRRPGYDLSARNAVAYRGDYGPAQLAYGAPDWVQAHRWGGVGACAMPLWVQMGERYLIFRSADGTLLGERPLRPGDAYNAWGPGSVFEPVTETDPWLTRVRKAVARAR